MKWAYCYHVQDCLGLQLWKLGEKVRNISVWLVKVKVFLDWWSTKGIMYPPLRPPAVVHVCSAYSSGVCMMPPSTCRPELFLALWVAWELRQLSRVPWQLGLWETGLILISLSLLCFFSSRKHSFFAVGKLHYLVHELLSPLPASLWDCPFSVCSCHILKVRKCGRNTMFFQVFFLNSLFSEDAIVKGCTIIWAKCRWWVFNAEYWVFKPFFISAWVWDTAVRKKILMWVTGNWFGSSKAFNFY